MAKTEKPASPPAKAAAKKAPAKAVAKKIPAKSAAKPTPAKKTPAHSAAAPPTHEEIAVAAYLRWKNRGHHHGRHHDDWHEAEQELIASRS